MIRVNQENYWQQLKLGLKELLLPTKNLCLLCNQEASYRNGLGKNCLARIALVKPPFCKRCGRSLSAEIDALCQQCETTNYYFRQARSVAHYQGALREYLAELKYHYRPELGRALGLFLLDWVKLVPEFQSSDLVLPIPIHAEKMLVRGYNQAALLAAPLSEYLHLKLETELLQRVKSTTSQNSLGKAARFENLNQAFAVTQPELVLGKRILLVDDILTTGATVSEAARVLVDAGAREVLVLTLASGAVE